MLIVNTTCWKCGGTMNAAVVHLDPEIRKGQMYGPQSFSSAEIKLAEENDVIIKEQYSSIRRVNYYANTCPHCGIFVSQHYLFTEIYCSAQYGDCEYTTIDIP